MRIGRLASAIGILLASPLFAAAPPDLAGAGPASQVQRMVRAMREDDYQGVLVYQHDGRIDSLRLFHAAGPVERERLVSLSGTPREVLRAGGRLVCRQGDAAPTVLSTGAGVSLVPLVPHLRSLDLAPNYQWVEAGEERVAGYHADVVELRAADEFRYGYRLWIERGSGLLLRAVLVGGGGTPLEQMMFVNLDIGAPPRAEDLGTPDAAVGQASQADVAAQGPELWTFSAMPPGFRVESRLAAPGGGGQHLLLTDGVANVSVYVEPRADNDTQSTSIGLRGALSVFSRELGRRRVVVLGNVPGVTVERIAAALVPAGD